MNKAEIKIKEYLEDLGYDVQYTNGYIDFCVTAPDGETRMVEAKTSKAGIGSGNAQDADAVGYLDDAGEVVFAYRPYSGKLKHGVDPFVFPKKPPPKDYTTIAARQLSQLTEAWAEYIKAREEYDKHKDFRTHDGYFHAIEQFKEAHASWKRIVRYLIQFKKL